MLYSCEDLRVGYQPKTSICTTEWSVEVFNSWVEDRNNALPEKVPTNLLEGKDLSSLSDWLGHLVVEVHWQDGKHYLPKTLQLLLFGLQRHVNSALRWSSCKTLNSRFAGRYWTHTTENYIRRALHGCSRKRIELLTREDEETLWQPGVLNPDTPQGLLSCVSFINGKNVCLHNKEESCVCARINESVLHLHWMWLKNRSGVLKQLKMEIKIVWQYESENADRCHVTLLDKYIQKLPTEAKQKDLFYVKPKDVAPKVAKTHLPHGSATFLLGTKMKAMSKDTGLGNGVTNHSLEAYGVTELFHGNVPEKLMQQRTWHRSLVALRKYERVAEEQVMDVCHVLDGTKPQQDKLLAIPDTPEVVLLEFIQPSPMLQPPWQPCFIQPLQCYSQHQYHTWVAVHSVTVPSTSLILYSLKLSYQRLLKTIPILT